MNTAFGYGVYALLLWLGSPPQPALVLAFAIGVAWNYFTTARLVFRARGFAKLPAYVFAYLTVYSANALALQFALSRDVDPFLAQALLTPVAAVASFLLLSRVFRDQPKTT
ncbi:MAG: GtrA family protein [Silicimonas sp.]|nr:GtrA family protein [Silicimonas sp.]NND42083.1 hypothetical protein [Silicimonas sp.]